MGCECIREKVKPGILKIFNIELPQSYFVIDIMLRMETGALSEITKPPKTISSSTYYRRNAKRRLTEVINPYKDARKSAIEVSQPTKVDTSPAKIFCYIEPLDAERNFTVNTKARNNQSREYKISYQSNELPKLSSQSPRSSLQLPRINPEQIKIAKKIESEFLQLLEQEKPAATIEKIRPIYHRALAKLKHTQTTQFNPIEMEALVYGICVSDSAKALPSFPRGYIELDDDFVAKIRTLARYVFSEKNKIYKPEDLSKITNWKNFFKSSNIRFHEYLTVKDLLKLTYPGWLEGERPLIRPHTLTLTGNYAHEAGEDTSKPSRAAVAAARCIFLDQEGVVDARGFYVPERIASIDWHEVYRDSETGIKNLIQDPDSKQFGRIYDAFDAAAPGIIGIKPGQILPWRLPRCLSWENKALADNQCQEILRYVLKQEGVLTAQGRPIASRIRDLAIADLIAKESSIAMNRSSYTNIYQLLLATFPESVGWKFDQINPGDIPYDGMWKGKPGLEIIKMRFAKGMYEFFEALKQQAEPNFIDHRVCFDPDAKRVLEINRNEMQTLKLYMSRQGISWKDLAVKFGIQSPFEDRFNGSTKKFFEGVFGKTNSKTGMLGTSGIYLEDVERKITNKDKAVDTLEGELDSKVTATNVVYRPSDGKNLVEYLLQINNSRPGKDSYTRKLYLAYAAANSKKLEHDNALGDSILAKMLSAKKRNSGEFHLSTRIFNGVIELLITVLVDRTNLSDHVKQLVTQRYSELMSTKERRAVLRERLLECVKKDPDFYKKNTFVSLINRIFELAFADIKKYESSFQKTHNHKTALYTKTFIKLEN